MIQIGVPQRPSTTNKSFRISRKSPKSRDGPDKNDFCRVASFVAFLASVSGFKQQIPNKYILIDCFIE